MVYEIYKDSELENVIEAEENFVSAYCSENGYTYKARQEVSNEPPTLDKRVADLEAQNKALTASNQFLEDCLVEMAGKIYA